MRPIPLLLSLLLAGCVHDRPSPRRDPGQDTGPLRSTEDSGTPAPIPRTLEVGTGDLAHHPLGPGSEITLVFGGQGGFHVDVSGQVQGLGEMVEVWVWVTRTDTGEKIATGSPIGTAMRLGEYDPDARTGVFVGERAFVRNNSLTWVCGMDGVRLEVKAVAEDLADRGARAGGWASGVARIDPSIAYACGTP